MAEQRDRRIERTREALAATDEGARPESDERSSAADAAQEDQDRRVENAADAKKMADEVNR